MGYKVHCLIHCGFRTFGWGLTALVESVARFFLRSYTHSQKGRPAPAATTVVCTSVPLRAYLEDDFSSSMHYMYLALFQ
jgi:hypothetical protein